MWIRRLLVLLAVTLGLGMTPASAQSTAFEAGQVWTLKPPMHADARIRVGRIENGGATVHISLWGVPISDPSISDVLNSPLVAGHLPITAEALSASVDRLVDEAPPENLDFENGYEVWRQDKGGVFTLTVPEIVEVMLQTIRTGQPSQQ